MMPAFHAADRLTERVAATSPVCVGLDPDIAKLPDGLPRDIAGVRAFCEGIIDSVADVASCIKPQLASFERFRADGMQLFWDVCAMAAQRGLIVIADGKRGDIGPTATAYAEAYLGEGSPIDFLTVTPFCGSDGVQPFIDVCKTTGKGIFVWVKASNPSSGDLLDLPVGDEVVHEHLAQLTESWAMHHHAPVSNFSFVGAVVGATYPEELSYLRTLMPHCPLLLPGYGAQGATAEDCVRGFLPDGTGAVVAATRSIIYADQGKEWRGAARTATQEMADALRTAVAARNAKA